LDLLALELGKSREEVVSLPHRMRDEARGKVPHNVMGNPEAQKVEEVFRLLGRMTWQSFVQNRLPLLGLPEDLKEALEAGSIPYTAALELKKVKDDVLRRALLEEAKAGLSLRELKAKVREALRREEAPRPWYREVAARLSRLDLEALPSERRRLVEGLLRELESLLPYGFGWRLLGLSSVGPWPGRLNPLPALPRVGEALGDAQGSFPREGHPYPLGLPSLPFPNLPGLPFGERARSQGPFSPFPCR
jgi:hypothetical protein